MSAPRFAPRDRVRAIDVSAAKGSKRRPSFTNGAELTVAQVVDDGRSISVAGHGGYWRVERFEAA